MAARNFVDFGVHIQAFFTQRQTAMLKLSARSLAKPVKYPVRNRIIQL
jgi:hypothetical protein